MLQGLRSDPLFDRLLSGQLDNGCVKINITKLDMNERGRYDPVSDRVLFDSDFVADASVIQIAGTLAHELLHRVFHSTFNLSNGYRDWMEYLLTEANTCEYINKLALTNDLVLVVGEQSAFVERVPADLEKPFVCFSYQRVLHRLNMIVSSFCQSKLLGLDSDLHHFCSCSTGDQPSFIDWDGISSKQKGALAHSLPAILCGSFWITSETHKMAVDSKCVLAVP